MHKNGITRLESKMMEWGLIEEGQTHILGHWFIVFKTIYK